MRGQTRGFFEDTGILLLLGAFIYGVYFLFSSDILSEKKIVPSLETSKTLSVDVNNSKRVLTKEVIITKDIEVEKIQPQIEQVKKIKKTEVPKQENSLKKIVKVEKKTTPRKITKEAPQVVKPKNEKTNTTKNVDLVLLREFLTNLELDVKKQIMINNDLNSTVNKVLKIRVTILKDGTYEDLRFMGGNKNLFDTSKQNILKLFPLIIRDEIKADFPRYVRLELK